MDIKFITEAPANEDLFKGQGHTKSATAIRNTLNSQSEIRIIGIEGELGGGKSTVINLLKKQLSASDSNYKFVDFDLQQHHNSSIKTALVNKIYDEVSSLVEDDADKHERLKSIRDIALGRILSYSKKVNSQLNPLILPFLIAVPFTAKYFEAALKITASTFNQIVDNGRYSVGLIDTIICFAGYSLFFFLALLIPIDRCINGDRKTYRQILGSIVKRDSDDEINETLSVSRSVSSVELQKAYVEFLKEVPDESILLLIIDNIDRVDADDFREVWSDLDIFVSNSSEKIRIILPYSILQVTSTLEMTREEVGEFFSKKIPVTFCAPSLITYDWRNVFIRFFSDAFTEKIDPDIARKCADLIEIWRRDCSPITPRYLKSHINRLASKALSVDSNELSLISCCAYTLSVSEAEVDYTDLLISPFVTYNDEDEIEPVKVKLSKTLQLLDAELGSEKRVRTIMCLHFQASYEVAESEVLISPIDDAINSCDANEILTLSQMYGFDHYFTQAITEAGVQTIAIVLRNIVVSGSSASSKFVETWLPLFDEITNKILFPVSLRDDYVDALKDLKKNKVHLSRKPLELTVNSIEGMLKKVTERVDEKKAKSIIYKIDQLYVASSFEDKTPEAIRNPSPSLFVNFLWDKRERFKTWNIEEISGSDDFRLNVLLCELDKTEKEVNNLDSIGRWFLLKNKIGFNRVDDSLDLFPSNLEEFGNVSFSGLGDQTHTTALVKLVEKSIENSKDPEKWVSLLFAHLVHNKLLSANISNGRQHLNAWLYIKGLLDKRSSYESELKQTLTLIPKFSDLLKALENTEHKNYLAGAVSQLLREHRIDSLSIDELVSSNQFEILKEIQLEEIVVLRWLEGWKEHLGINFEKWTADFLDSVLGAGNESFIRILKLQFDSADPDETYLNRLIDNASQNTVKIVDHYQSENWKLKNSSKTGEEIKNILSKKSENELAEYSNAEWLSKLISILPANTTRAIVRKYESRLLPKTVSVIEKFSIIRNFHNSVSLTVDSEDAEKVAVLLFQECNEENIEAWLDAQNYDFEKWQKASKGDLLEILNKSDRFPKVRAQLHVQLK